MPHAGKAGAHALLAEQPGHQAEPERGGQRQIKAVTGLHRHWRMRVDHHGEQRQEEQRRLGIQAIGDEPRDEGATTAALAGCQIQLGTGRVGRTRAQRLDADIQQVGCCQPFQRVEQADGLRHDQADTEQRISDVDQNPGAHSEGGEQSRAATVADALAHNDGEIRPRAGHRQQVNQGNGEKFTPVHGGSASTLKVW